MGRAVDGAVGVGRCKAGSEASDIERRILDERDTYIDARGLMCVSRFDCRGIV